MPLHLNPGAYAWMPLRGDTIMYPVFLFAIRDSVGQTGCRDVCAAVQSEA
jgi:hypothetical protein